MSDVFNIYVRCAVCNSILKKSITIIVYKPRGQPEIRVDPCQECMQEARADVDRERAQEE